ncbi:efflux RND transporter periplasmic adaptor subunit [Methylopila sp. M107]|uniref:efflux RND transporter periplasmic adaptor subunit n=1 Tax=Methylopila sp. M107 TaxID=1101190 RepID=UPI00037A5FA9|nr:efflux RND transporter periplasmic adaptor subunit [Methylopila sp. M107]
MSSRFSRLGRTAAATAALALAGVAIISFEAGPDSAPAKAAAAEQATPASVARVEKRPVANWSAFSGRLEAVDRVEIRPRVAGEVISAQFREGAIVKRGDVLFSIDRAPYAAAVDRAKAEVAATEARAKLARADLDRGRKMTSIAITSRDLDQRESELRSAEAAKQGAEAALRSAELDLGYTEIRAPVAGRVGRIEVTQGNLVAAGPGAPVLTRLVSVDPIYASFDADERAVLKALDTLPEGVERSAAIGAIPVEMSTNAGGATARGKLQYVDPSVQAAAGTVRVRAEFPNPDGRLFPGQFARLKMGEAKDADAVLVSERAVGVDQDKSFVLVVGDDDRAAYREIRLGASADGLKIVLEGLSGGERVVVEGLQKLRPGALVAPQPVAMNGMKLDQRQASVK